MATKSGSSSAARKHIPKKVCTACGIEKPLEKGFYSSKNPFHSDGFTPICRDCVVGACSNEDGSIDVNRVESVMRQLDKPFLLKEWKNTVEKYGTDSARRVVGMYLKNINSLPQYSSMTYDEGVKFSERSSVNQVSNLRRRANQDKFYLQNDGFDVTEDVIRLFGEGYTAKEYETMQRIYDDLQQEYPNISSNQKNLLLRYVRFAAKEEIATSNGVITDAEKWSKMATDALKQLNSIDTQGGISSFSEFFRDFERVKDVSRILPKFKYRPNDAPDFIIWCYINYCRRLEGKPEVEYADVYKFYDEKISEYLKQYGDPYGIFTDDPTLGNRERIKEFIELPPDYDDGEE